MYQTASPVYITGEHVLLMYFDVDKDNDSTELLDLMLTVVLHIVVKRQALMILETVLL